uniref:Uncharacterized protein n=1 Tax=Equus caballus TaxID=9796 RepID=A0A5F5PZ43_HORSE
IVHIKAEEKDIITSLWGKHGLFQDTAVL